MRDRKNAGLKMEDRKCRGGKCRTGKCGTIFTLWIELKLQFQNTRKTSLLAWSTRDTHFQFL